MMHKNKILGTDSLLQSEARVKLEEADASNNDPNNVASYSKEGVEWHYSPFSSTPEISFGQPEENRINTHLGCVKSESEYVCSICGLETGTASRLRRHSRIHIKDKTHHACMPIDGTLHKYENCFSKFTQKSSLRYHKKLHNRIKEFKFEECPTANINHRQLVDHTIKHTGDKIYHGQECGEGFATATRLSYHQVTHTAERSSQGQVCGETLQEKTALITQNSVHLTRGPYMCNMCGEMFPRINSLTLHQRVHQTDSTYSYVPQNGKPVKETIQENRKKSPLPFSFTPDIVFKDTDTQNENKPPVREGNSIQAEKHDGNDLNRRNVNLQNFQEDLPISSTTDTMASFKVQGEKYTFAGNVLNIPHPDIVQEALATGTLLESQGEDGQIYLIVLPRTIAEQDYTRVTLPAKITSVTAPVMTSEINSVSPQNQGTEENTCNLLMWDNELDIAEVSFKPDSEVVKSEQSKNKEYAEEDSSSKETGSHACSKKFGSTRVKQKEKSKEKKVYTYECKSCGKKCKNSSSYVIHMRTHTGERPYYCGYCGVGFKQVTHLKSHIRIHTGEKPYKCNQCDAAFHQSSQLHAHFKAWHVRKHERMKEKDKVRGSIRNFYCKICDKTFVNSCFKKQHMKTHIDELQYVCNKCEATFKTKSRLQRHEKLHIHDSFKICEICGLHFKDVSSLNHHRFTIHELPKGESEEIRFPDEKKQSERNGTEISNDGDSSGSLANVNHTSMVGKEQWGLKTQTYIIKKSSKNVQIHSCKICQKTFKQKTNLNTHMRVHTDERPYKCEDCGSAFHQISHLKDHAKIHSGEKPFKCSVCLALFVQSSAAKTHIKKHHCGQGFVVKDERSDFFAKESIVLKEIPRSDDDITVVIKIESGASLSVEVQIERNVLGIIEEDEKDAGVQKKNRRKIPAK